MKHATALQGDVGFPDLVLTRRGVTLIVELKSDSGRPGLAQLKWLNAMAGVVGNRADWVSTSAIPAYVETSRSESFVVIVAYPRHWRWLIDVLQTGRLP